MGDETLLQRHFANLRHIRDLFPIDPRAQRGTGQVAPWLSGIVTLVHPAFPGSFQFNDPEVRGFADPAAGANFAITIPPNEAWGLRALSFIFTTDANVANRSVILSLDDTVNIFFNAPAASVQAASGGRRYSFGRSYGYDRNLAGGTEASGLPDVILDQGWRIQSSVGLLQVGDQISALAVLVDVFPR